MKQSHQFHPKIRSKNNYWCSPPLRYLLHYFLGVCREEYVNYCPSVESNKRQPSAQGEKRTIAWLADGRKHHFPVSVRTPAEGQATEQAENRCPWQWFMSTKRKNSKCLDVCVTDLPVFKEILRCPSKPVSPGGHKARESESRWEVCEAPRDHNYIRDLPWRGWAQVRSLASEMGRARMVLTVLPQLSWTKQIQKHPGGKIKNAKWWLQLTKCRERASRHFRTDQSQEEQTLPFHRMKLRRQLVVGSSSKCCQFPDQLPAK